MAPVNSGNAGLGANADAVTERALLVRIAQNDQSALTELFDRTAPRLYAVLLRWVTRGSADLILQRVFMQLWNDRSLRSSSSDQPLLGLIEAARGLAFMEGSRRSPGQGLDRPGVWPGGPSPEAAPSAGAAPNPRDLLRSIYIDGSTVQELASRHGLSPAALHEMLVAAMNELRRELRAEK